MAVNLDAIDSKQQHPLGHKYEDPLSFSIFRYIKYDNGTDNLTPSVGDGTVWFDTTLGKATSDYSDASVTQPAGFLQAALTDAKFGWIQTRGINRKDITTDTGVVDNNKLVLDSANDGHVDTMLDGEEEQVVAVALKDDGDTTETVLDAGQAFIEIE